MGPLLYQTRGGMEASGVTWPWSVQISIPVKEIDVVEYRRLKLGRPLRRPSLKFLHGAPVANPVTFIAFSLDRAVRVLSELGVKIADK